MPIGCWRSMRGIFPYGTGSPLDRFRALGGKILLLGSDHDEVTFLHHVEHTVEFAGKRISRYKVPYDVDGQIVWREVEEVNTAGDGAHANWPDRFFALIVDGYLQEGTQRRRPHRQCPRVSNAGAGTLRFCRSNHAGDRPTGVADTSVRTS